MSESLTFIPVAETTNAEETEPLEPGGEDLVALISGHGRCQNDVPVGNATVVALQVDGAGQFFMAV